MAELHRALGIDDPRESPQLKAWHEHMITAQDLRAMSFPPPIAYIEGLVLEGLSILGGKPKLGKSWWALSAALTIACGGMAFGNRTRAVTAAPVLYLALEDGHSRLRDRISRLLAPTESWPKELTLATEWPRLDKGGVDLLVDAVDADGYQVVVIDTLARVRIPKSGRDAYQEDADAMAGLHDLVRERPGLALLVVHHNRKNDDPDDYVDALSGTTGITGVVDHIAVLQRGRGDADAVLHFTSRDAAEHDTAFEFDRGEWIELGPAVEYELSKARRAVLAAVEGLGVCGVTEVADVCGKDKASVLRMLRALEGEDLVQQDGPRGLWKLHQHDQLGQHPPRVLTELYELTVNSDQVFVHE